MGGRKNLRTYLLMAVVFISYCSCPVLATTYYVNPGESIQDAIDGASYGDTVEVAAGTYVELITLKNGVALIGAGQDTTTIDGNYAGSVVTSIACDPNTVLEGFTITKGWADWGGGMVTSGNPTVTNCTFIDNFASEGAGIFNIGPILTVTNCTFNYNWATFDVGIGSYANGGGMYNYEWSRPIVANCTFIANLADGNGGGMYNAPECDPTVTNCTFIANEAEYNGGGMQNYLAGEHTITNCTFWYNWGNYGGGGMIGGWRVTNCILWGNEGSQIIGGHVTYSNVQGGCPGTGNIDADPLFVDANGLDNIPGTEDDNLRLLPGSPCIDAGDNTAVPGGVTTDLDGNPRFVDDPATSDTGNPPGADAIVDMGAYEYHHIYVDQAAAPAGNGCTWATAYKYLQNALADSSASGKDILVAEGIYKPDQTTANPGGTGDREATFQLINDVAIYGGYAGFGEPDPNARDIDLYETILSGDLNGDDVGFTNNAENSYHVVTGSGTDETAILDGFTITAGNADGSYPDNQGGGMYNNDSSPTVTNCTFTANSADYGGGMYNTDSSATKLINCAFSGNSAGGRGGGMCNFSSSPVLTNCTFSGNLVGQIGGGMYNTNSSNPAVTNCILWGNSDSGGYDESAQIYNSSSSTTNINYSCVQGWTGSLGGTGNIGNNPMFKDADGPDDIFGTADDNLRLAAGSACIDAGDNFALPADVTTDLGGAPRIAGGSIDMGAYEWDSPVAHWKLNERGGTMAWDSSGNGHHGTLYGDPNWQPGGGRIAGALDFHGSNDYVETGKTASALGIGGNAPRTVTTWVYTRSFNNGGIFEMGQHTAGQDFSLRTRTSDNWWRVQYWGSDPVTGDYDFTFDSKNKWVHFAHVHDGTATRVYANGTLVMDEPRTLSTANTKTFKMGQWGGSYFDGLIDDVRIYNYALSAGEVRWLLCARPPRGDLNHDCRVDFVDFAILASSWLDCGLILPELCAQ